MLSTIGVLLGLMIMGQPFGVVMTGIGVIANAGVIVNNNIVLIDTYDRLRREGMAAYDAILETCRERARPVVLTAVTAILGVLPIAFGVNLDFLLRESHGRRAGDAMVDQSLDRDRVRSWLCDDSDADRDAGGVDGDRASGREARALDLPGPNEIARLVRPRGVACAKLLCDLLLAYARNNQRVLLSRVTRRRQHHRGAGDRGQHRPIGVAEIRRDADRERKSAHRSPPSRRRRSRMRLPAFRAAARRRRE